MAIEVEVKCRVSDFSGLEEQLRHRCGTPAQYDKQDLYFAAAGQPENPCFRLRSSGNRLEVTCKEKQCRDGFEQNLEYEFAVSDAAQFSGFAAHLGYRPVITKRKQGLRFQADGVSFELSHVEGLGDYLEIEILLPDDASEAQIDAARVRLRRLLGELGFSDADIEPRYYTDLLQQSGKSR